MDDPIPGDGDLSRFCCQNPACAEHGRRGAGNLTVAARIGKGGQYRLLRCRACKARFSERKGTVLFRSQTPPATVASILAHVQEGCGMRQAGRLVGTKEDTVIRYARLAGRHAERLQDEVVAFSLGDGGAAIRREVVVRPEPFGSAQGEASRDPDSPTDGERGDRGDHVAFDPEHRLVLSVVPGKRTVENAAAVVADAAKRMSGRAPRLVTTDEHGPSEQAVLGAFGVDVTPPRTGRPGRPRKARREPHPDLTYATVRKTRAAGRVASVVTTLVFGTAATLAAALGRSACSTHVNTSFVERVNGTDRHRDARKARKTYRFSKDGPTHDAVGSFAAYSYNFCWPVRTLAEKVPGGTTRPRTPAMAAGLTGHVWSLTEWLSLPAISRAA